VLGSTATIGAQVPESTNEDQKLTISTDELNDGGFGLSVAVDGDTMVIGAPTEGDNGAAYVFELADGAWVQQQRLTGSHPSIDDEQFLFFETPGNFGHSVAIEGDTIVIGAPFEEEPFFVGAFGIAESSAGNGAAYVFNLEGDEWQQTDRLIGTGSDDFIFGGFPLEQRQLGFIEQDGPGDQFGLSVAIDGDTIVVGAPFDQSNSINDQLFGAAVESPSPGTSIGAAYVFDLEGDEWQQTDRLGGTNFELAEIFGDSPILLESLFGYSVAIDNDTIVVGAPLDAEASAFEFFLSFGFAPITADNGAAYIFELDGGWEQTARLTGDTEDAPVIDVQALGDIGFVDNGDQFGYSVAVDQDTVVVGALLEDGQSTDEGAVYVFGFDGTWSEQDVLTPNDASPGDRFGRSVGVSDDLIVAGAPFADLLSGSAYVFAFDGTWTQQNELAASDIEPGEGFGFSIAMSEGTAVVGAPLNLLEFEPLVAFGSEVSLENGSGAAYVFDITEEPPAEEPPVEEPPAEEPPAEEPAETLFCNGLPVTVNLADGDVATNGPDVILGTDGDDVINGLDGPDVICGGGGDDSINAGSGADIVMGGSGNDSINAGPGRDIVLGQSGNDFVSGGRGMDTISGGLGNDDLRGNEGVDLLNGGSGDDELRGGQRGDVLNGNNGNDLLIGGIRPDILDGGNGLDQYNGGASLSDTCVADPAGRTEIATNCELQ